MQVEQLKIRNRRNVDSTDRRAILLPSTELTPAPQKERRRAEFFDVIGSSLAIETPEQFCAWAQGDLQHVFPHGMLICGIGKIENQSAHIQNLLTCNLSPEYMQALHQTGGMGSGPVCVQWLKTRRPVLFELDAQHAQTAWLDNFKRHGLENMAAHGQCDLNSNTTSYFSFSKIHGKLTSRHSVLLEMLVPHLHVALIRAFAGEKNETHKPASTQASMTAREQEILQWISSGKTNQEIARQLSISENTVKNHVQRVLTKLNVKTRAQAMVKVLTPA